jgi:hypothetical protein
VGLTVSLAGNRIEAEHHQKNQAYAQTESSRHHLFAHDWITVSLKICSTKAMRQFSAVSEELLSASGFELSEPEAVRKARGAHALWDFFRFDAKFIRQVPLRAERPE